ncbi:dihydroorotate dehydrogenase B (NAD(+)), catalytic subunit [Spirochaetia bacterium]|nr:dihydroorotate dehydrogenase B (NAD(+)), catalytic subunit [Spirochaetia bacterium]
MKPCLCTNFAGVPLKNPLVLASGTCGFGREFSELFDLGRLGGICSKGLTLNPKPGNEGIRIWETAAGVMNSVGLENPGVPAFIETELPFMHTLGPRTQGPALIVNLGGHTIDDYLAGVELLNDADFDILELNISCPNVKAGGMAFGVKTETARDVVRRVRSICKHPLMVKLSPNAEDITALARACEEEGADAVSLTNTFLAMAIDIQKRRPVFENTYAGLSGPAIKPIALRMVHQCAGALQIPVMGAGGITSWQDAVEYLMAGAAAVQIGTANFIKPEIALDILAGIEAWMESQGIGDIAEIRGIV